MDLLRLATAGSVDDGKSTLIGRLLYDAKAVLADQLAHVEERSVAVSPSRNGLCSLSLSSMPSRSNTRRWWEK